MKPSLKVALVAAVIGLLVFTIQFVRAYTHLRALELPSDLDPILVPAFVRSPVLGALRTGGLSGGITFICVSFFGLFALRFRTQPHQLALIDTPGRAWTFVSWSAAALCVSVCVVPMFAYELGSQSYVAFPGTLIAFFAALVAGWAFISCPRRALISKVLTLLLLLPSLFLGFDCFARYLMFGLSR